MQRMWPLRGGESRWVGLNFTQCMRQSSNSAVLPKPTKTTYAQRPRGLNLLHPNSSWQGNSLWWHVRLSIIGWHTYMPHHYLTRMPRHIFLRWPTTSALAGASAGGIKYSNKKTETRKWNRPYILKLEQHDPGRSILLALSLNHF